MILRLIGAVPGAAPNEKDAFKHATTIVSDKSKKDSFQKILTDIAQQTNTDEQEVKNYFKSKLPQFFAESYSDKYMQYFINPRSL